MPPNSHDVGLPTPSTATKPTDPRSMTTGNNRAGTPAGTIRSGSGGGSSVSSPPGIRGGRRLGRTTPTVPIGTPLRRCRRPPTTSAERARRGPRRCDARQPTGAAGAVPEKSSRRSGGEKRPCARPPPMRPTAGSRCSRRVPGSTWRCPPTCRWRSWCRWCWSWSASRCSACVPCRGGCPEWPGGPLPAEATLTELGVLDGELLRLAPEGPAPASPVFDDPVDALAATRPRPLPAIGGSGRGRCSRWHLPPRQCWRGAAGRHPDAGRGGRGAGRGGRRGPGGSPGPPSRRAATADRCIRPRAQPRWRPSRSGARRDGRRCPPPVEQRSCCWPPRRRAPRPRWPRSRCVWWLRCSSASSWQPYLWGWPPSWSCGSASPPPPRPRPSVRSAWSSAPCCRGLRCDSPGCPVRSFRPTGASSWTPTTARTCCRPTSSRNGPTWPAATSPGWSADAPCHGRCRAAGSRAGGWAGPVFATVVVRGARPPRAQLRRPGPGPHAAGERVAAGDRARCPGGRAPGTAFGLGIAGSPARRAAAAPRSRSAAAPRWLPRLPPGGRPVGRSAHRRRDPAGIRDDGPVPAGHGACETGGVRVVTALRAHRGAGPRRGRPVAAPGRRRASGGRPPAGAAHRGSPSATALHPSPRLTADARRRRPPPPSPAARGALGWPPAAACSSL